MKRILIVFTIVFTMLFGMCIPVFAEQYEEEIYITDLSDEEIEWLKEIQLFGTSTSEKTIAKWMTKRDNSQTSYGFTVSQYYPLNGATPFALYKVFNFQNKYYLMFYNSNTKFLNNTDYRAITSGSIIVLTFDTLNEVKEILFDKDLDRTAITATYYGTDGEEYRWLGQLYTITHCFDNTTHYEIYEEWYENEYHLEPPLLNNNGTCVTHVYNKLTKNPSCTEEGKYTYVCYYCSDMYTESIPMLEHSYNKQLTKNPTCNEIGKYTYTCENCSDYYTEDIPMIEHSYENGTCTVCGNKDTNYVPPSDGNDNNNDNDNSGILSKIFELLKELVNPNPNYSFIADMNNKLAHKLEDNGFYTSICKIQRELTSIYNEDYTSKTGFAELGLTKMTLRRPSETISVDFGNDIIGSWEQEYTVYTSKIDWGLENIDIMPMGWFFGQQVGTAGDGTPYYSKGVKSITDPLISAFLWISFAFMLWQKLPNIISGELSSVTTMTGDIINTEVAEKRRIEDMYNKAEAKAEIDKYNKSYEKYETDRMRKEEYAARYYKEHKKGDK